MAIRTIIPADLADRNLRAFHIGRKIAVQPDLFVVEARREYRDRRVKPCAARSTC